MRTHFTPKHPPPPTRVRVTEQCKKVQLSPGWMERISHNVHALVAIQKIHRHRYTQEHHFLGVSALTCVSQTLAEWRETSMPEVISKLHSEDPRANIHVRAVLPQNAQKEARANPPPPKKNPSRLSKELSPQKHQSKTSLFSLLTLAEGVTFSSAVVFCCCSCWSVSRLWCKI